MDVSASTNTPCTGSNVLLVSEIIAVTAMVIARVEKNYILKAFSNNIIDVDISPTDKLTEVMDKMRRINFGSTNCSAPMVDALNKKADIDAFIVLTDNETNYGIHPSQAIKEYRKTMNKPESKMIVAAMSPCNFTIADPQDMNSIDICGGSTDTISTIMEFVAGKI